MERCRETAEGVVYFYEGSLRGITLRSEVWHQHLCDLSI